MTKVECLYDKKYRKEIAYDIYDFPYQDLMSKTTTAKGGEYIEQPATFDIETSTVEDKSKSFKKGRKCYYGFMYHWQMCVEGKVCFGRTWGELRVFLAHIKEQYELNMKRRLVIYCHNLSYEFHFMYKLFKMSEIFSSKPRQVIKCIMDDVYEMRCSYILSNMSLQKFIENTPGTHHQKGVDDLNYRNVYTAESELTPKELGYCYNDVMGLYECLLTRLQSDTLKSIPLTSTGYVRRECRRACRENANNRKMFEKTQLNLDQYYALKKAFRGGNTASNRYRTDRIYKNVSSYDISSSYPYVMLSEMYPIGKFMEVEVEEDTVEEYNSEFCTVGKYIFSNLRIKTNIDIPIPYIPFSKCEKFERVINYNGRLLRGRYIEIYLTNIDFDIVKRQYDWDELYIDDYYVSRKGYLPVELRNKIYEYFRNKTTLKNVVGYEYEYTKAKNLLNAIYGMTVTDILRDEIYFYDDDGSWMNKERGEETVEDEEDKKIKERETDTRKLTAYYNNRNNFLPYQWGVWVTAYARRNLQKVIDIIGLDMIYCDTDSVKFVGDYSAQINEVNHQIIRDNLNRNINHSIRYNKRNYYLGIWEHEKFTDKYKNIYPFYTEFITLGAKKYAYTLNKECHVTVAGLSKKLGAEELSKKGGLESFRIGTTFYNSGRTEAHYNADEEHLITVNGCQMINASNIAIVDTTYTLGMSDTMLSILDTLEKLM